MKLILKVTDEEEKLIKKHKKELRAVFYPKRDWEMFFLWIFKWLQTLSTISVLLATGSALVLAVIDRFYERRVETIAISIAVAVIGAIAFAAILKKRRKVSQR